MGKIVAIVLLALAGVAVWWATSGLESTPTPSADPSPRQIDAPAPATQSAGPTTVPATQEASTDLSDLPDLANFPTTIPADASSPLIQTMPDGTMLVDRLYPLSGQGTEDDPYVLPWVYLLSAKETYRPEEGGWELPARVTMLDGKHVIVCGYLAVPVYTRQAERIMLTWNMIDACHGIKPKPFEAVEVALDDAIEVQPHTLTVLAVRGVLRLDPKLEQGWLLTLYRLENGTVEQIGK
jgi:hypothetical protein